jgi:hypothetical protein
MKESSDGQAIRISWRLRARDILSIAYWRRTRQSEARSPHMNFAPYPVSELGGPKTLGRPHLGRANVIEINPAYTHLGDIAQ